LGFVSAGPCVILDRQPLQTQDYTEEEPNKLPEAGTNQEFMEDFIAFSN
jgi:hypothetical protein